MGKKTLNKADLVDALREAGLDRVRDVVLHSSLSSLGSVEGGAETVIDAVMGVLGPEGTLMAPTFNYVLWDGVFDPENVVSETGTITNTLRKRAGAVRSTHPTYSVAAMGKRAAEFTVGHWKAEPVGVDSPIDRLAKAGGYVFLLGVKHDTDSTMHVGEAYAGVPYRGVPYHPLWPRTAKVRTDSGEIVSVDLHDEPGCSTGFGVIELPLRETGRIRDFKIERAKCQLVKSQDVIDATVRLVQERTDILLCANPKCYFCPRAREEIRSSQQAGTS
jgi:aminoglycoside 3-N-acetyltransferase